LLYSLNSRPRFYIKDLEQSLCAIKFKVNLLNKIKAKQTINAEVCKIANAAN